MFLLLTLENRTSNVHYQVQLLFKTRIQCPVALILKSAN